MGFRSWVSKARDLAQRVGLIFLLAPAVAWPQSEGPGPSVADTTDHSKPPAPAEPISFLPLPIYATLPNEGPTYGFMPVFLDTERESGRITSILAPSAAWNGVSHITTTGRYFMYPSEHEERILQGTYATRLFREGIASWSYQPMEKGEITRVFAFEYRKDPYRRFFGIGKDTPRNNETSYTLESFKPYARVGYNLTESWNLGGMAGFSYYNPYPQGVQGLRSTFQDYSALPGMTDASSFYTIAYARYDTRKLREYSEEGLYADLNAGGAVSNRARGGLYGLTSAETRAMWKEIPRVNGAARARWGYTYGANIPFYEQQSLGGSFLLRGFILDRFVDHGAWTLDFEQRITAIIVHVEGSTVHFRVDPFVTVGQVYRSFSEMASRVQAAPGIGIRFFSPPSVIGRIDVAKGGPDVNVYTELGYPF